MNRNHLHHSLIGIVTLLAIGACAVPEQEWSPAPAEGPNVSETAVTVPVFTEPTVQESLITVTPTFVPTKTLTPTPAISQSGTSLVLHSDGSTQFTDYLAGMQILIPAEWLAVRVGEPEYYQAWGKVGTQHPELLVKFASIQNLDPNTFRMTAVDIRPEHILYENAPTIDVVFAQGDTRTLNEVRNDQAEKRLPLSKYKLLSSDVQKISEGFEAAIIEYQWESATSANQLYMSYSRRVMFKVPSGSMSIDLHIPLDQRDTVGLEFDQILSSITLFAP